MVEPSIGMMEGAYFVSKNDILSWLNGLLNVILINCYFCLIKYI